MLGYFKAEPTEFARLTVNGKVKKEGTGVSCFYLPYRTSIELLSIASTEQPFVFQEISKDNQEVSLQGGLIYRVQEPSLTLVHYNHSIGLKTKEYLTEDSLKLPQHLLQLVQKDTKRIVQETSLENILLQSDSLAEEVLRSLHRSSSMKNLGVGIEMLYFSSIRPKPEIAKALEASYRESLLQKADQAIYARRALAVEKERAIQENEMTTKIEMEEKRKGLVELESANTLKVADTKAEALRRELAVYHGMDPATLTAHALNQLGRNATKIENLSITPEFLAGLMKKGA